MVGLPDAIRTLRAELSEAMKEGAGEEVRFRVGPVELEFGVEVTQEAGVSGGIKFWVVSLEAEGKGARATTHRLTLTLMPLDSSGADLQVGGRVSERPK
jgi:hypothetical protein